MLRKFLTIATFFLGGGLSAAIESVCDTIIPQQDTDGCYQISRFEELCGFSKIVFEGEADACGKLTADITINEEMDYYYKPDTVHTWKGIGDYKHPFAGTFDGQNHTLLGLHTSESTELLNSYAGFFPYIMGDKETVIKNLNIVNAFADFNFHSSTSGGLVGIAKTDLRISNTSINENLYGNKIGGFVGDSYGHLIIENSHMSGRVDGQPAGGFVGIASWVEIYNCYNEAKILRGSSDHYGGFVARATYQRIANSYSIGNTYQFNGLMMPIIACNDHDSYIENVFYIDSVYYKSEKYRVGSYAPAEFFENGSIATLLHNYNQNGINGSIWGQNVGIDKAPTFSGKIENASVKTQDVVLKLANGKDTTISYIEGVEFDLPSYIGDTQVFAWYDNKEYKGPAIDRISLDSKGPQTFYGKTSTIKEVDNCYEISDLDKLFEFASIVNNGNSDACGYLTADVEGDTNRFWTPIGISYLHAFSGTFDGRGHVISGLFANKEKKYTCTTDNDMGLFGDVQYGKNVTIKNVGIDRNSHGEDNDYSYLVNRVDDVENFTIENCYNSATKSNMGFVKTAYRSKIVIQNSFFYLDSTFSHSGFVRTENDVNLTVKNSFYLADSSLLSWGTASSKDDFENGTVTKKLQEWAIKNNKDSIWIQGDDYPVLKIPNFKYIFLRWDSPDDFFAMKDIIKDDKTIIHIDKKRKLYTKGKILSGFLKDKQVHSIKSDTLWPTSGLSILEDSSAIIDRSEGSVIIPEDIPVKNVTVKGLLELGEYYIMTFPFDMNLEEIPASSDFYFRFLEPRGCYRYPMPNDMSSYEGIITEEDSLKLYFAKAKEIEAHKPYFVSFGKTYSYTVLPDAFYFNNSTILKSTRNAPTEVRVGDYLYRGNYSFKIWNEDAEDFKRAYSFIRVNNGKYIERLFRRVSKDSRSEALSVNLIYAPESPDAPDIDHMQKNFLISFNIPKDDDNLTSIGSRPITPQVKKSVHYFDAKGRGLKRLEKFRIPFRK